MNTYVGAISRKKLKGLAPDSVSTKRKFVAFVKKGVVTGTRRQFLLNTWTITINKGQGSTVDKLVVRFKES